MQPAKASSRNTAMPSLPPIIECPPLHPEAAPFPDHPLLEQAELTGKKFSLEPIHKALDFFNHPQRGFACVHIAGTNGKGSTARILAACLTALGIQTGLFTSPHLLSPTERIQIGWDTVPPEMLTAALGRIEAYRDSPGWTGPILTYFETMALAAYLIFREQHVKVAVIETGMGGRLDATNVVQAPLCVIPSIAFDHERFLGHTLDAIAREKAGIIHGAARVLLGPLAPEAEAAMRDQAPQAHFEIFGHSFNLTGSATHKGSWTYTSTSILNGLHFPPGNLAPYQAVNTALALRALEVFAAERDLALDASLLATLLPRLIIKGRLEVLTRDPLLVLDAAHNPAGISALAAALSVAFPGQRFHWIAGFSKDRDLPVMLKALEPFCQSITVTAFDHARAFPRDALRSFTKQTVGSCPVNYADTFPEALHRVRDKDPGAAVLVAGSIYFLESVYRWHRQPGQRGD